MPRNRDPSNTGGDTEDDIDKVLDDAEKVVDDAGEGMDEVGEAVQDGEKAADDARDGDQDTADKASNVGHDGADGVRDLGEALDDWGIGDPGLDNIANEIDDFTEDVFGKKHPPDTLPPVRYRVFFGAKDDLMSGLENMAENAMGDAMGIADGMLEGLANEIGASDYLGTDPFSSVMEKHSPFAEDPDELDDEESIWSVSRVRVDEGLNRLWRCEILLTANEIRDTALEAILDDQTTSSGGLIDQIAGPIKSAMSTVERLSDIYDGKDGVDKTAQDDVDYEAMKEAEADVAQAEEDLAEAREYAAMLRELLADAPDADPPATPAEIAQLNQNIAAADPRVTQRETVLKIAKQRLQRERIKARESSSSATGVAERIDGAMGAADRLTSADSVGDAFGALSDLIYGGGQGGFPDGPVYVNVPLDPADFLGQTCSLRVSREFMTAAPVTHPFDVPGHSFTARYLTGAVVEMEDLGTRQTTQGAVDSPFGTSAGLRWLRLVIRPELAKLSLRRDHRVFNKQTPLEIIREVFRSAGVYGFQPDIPGLGLATEKLVEAVSHIPIVGNAMGDALSGQFIKMIPPVSGDLSFGGNKMGAHEWTQKREMCVQYGETDLDFVRRLLEEEGIHFTFTCRRGFERIVFVDDPVELDESPTVDGRPVTMYWPQWQSSTKTETIHGGAERRSVRASTVTMRDYSMSTFEQRPHEQTYAEVSGSGAPPPEAIRPSYATRFEYPASFPYQYLDSDSPIHYRDYGQLEGDRHYARLRLGEEMTHARRVTLRTDVVGTSCDTKLRVRGYPFERDGIPLPRTDGPPPADPVVIDRVRWEGAGAGAATFLISGPTWSTGTGVKDYENELTGWWVHMGSAKRIPIRPPRRTPKPRITSLQTATVVDWEGDHDEDEEIEHDHATLTRVRVRFHWDRQGELPLGIMLPLLKRGYTCFCRVARAWAGDDYGVSFVPRIGSEVVVAFENGDPDRPVVIGSLYDAEHPVPLPGREAKRPDFTPPKAAPPQMSTIATRTSPWDEDDGVASEYTFDDTAGAERVFVKAGRHLIEEVKTDHRTEVDHDQRIDVGRHHGEIIQKQQTMEVLKEREETVRGSRKVVVKGHRQRDVGGDQEVLVTLQHAETVGGVTTLKVVGDRKLKVRGRRFTKVGIRGDLDAHDLHDVGGKKTDEIKGVLEVRAGALATGMSGSGPDAPGASIGVGPDGVSATADNTLELIAEGEVRIISEEASVDIEFANWLDASNQTEKINVGSNDADGGMLIEGFTTVEVKTKSTEMVANTEVSLEAKGEAKATAKVAPSGIELFGKTGVIKAKVAINDEAAATKVGP